MRYASRSTLVSMTLACFLVAGDQPPGNGSTQKISVASQADLALRWAPVHYQDVDKKGGTGAGGKSDFMTRFDYDGDFNGRNNWDNLDSRATPSHMYFTVSESDTHFFIYYVAYHPRDWCPGFCEEHENDGEGCVMLVRKDGTQFGRLEAIVTVFHGDWKSYRAQSYVGKGVKNPETPQDIVFESVGGVLHPRTYQEPSGHGFIGCTANTRCVKADDGIRYVPSTTAAVPPLPPDGVQVTVNYSLIELSMLFSRRLDWPTFSSSTSYNGDDSGSCGAGLSTCPDNAAKGIWSHNDGRTSFDDNSLIGEDPAMFFAGFFSFSGGNTAPSGTYRANRLIHQKCSPGRRMQGSSDPCVAQVCAADPYCCNNSWDGICLGEVTSVCGLSCQNCNASICSVHAGPITSGCDGACAKSVCAADPYCCQFHWDSICVSEVSSICGLKC